MANIIKKKFKILNMHCTSCAIMIDGELEETEGVINSRTNFGKSLTEVEYDQEKITEEKVIKIIQQSGYQAELVKD
jgi:copper chaperone CopZ